METIFSKKRVEGFRFIKKDSIEEQFINEICKQFHITEDESYRVLDMAMKYSDCKNKEILKTTNVGELKEDDVLVFQFNKEKIDAHTLGIFMKMMNEQGIKAIVFPQIDKIVEKHDAENTMKLLELTKVSLDNIINKK